MGIEDKHIEELRQAKSLLENPSFVARISNVLAQPVEKGLEFLPNGAREQILSISESSLNGALKLALYTLGDEARLPSNLKHKAGIALSGAAGGAFGLPALAAELPVSTTIILRSIADIARSEGEELETLDAQLACLEVFALGGASSADDAADTGYFAIRASLARAVSEAAAYAAKTGAISETAPALIRLISQVAVRFSIPVTNKAAAQAVPILGAAGGAIVNTLFLDHFQDAARGHFVVRRLERSYGGEVVREIYDSIPVSKSDSERSKLDA